jgi:redox-sensing transcriptional repressor
MSQCEIVHNIAREEILKHIPEKVLERLIIYRRLLMDLENSEVEYLYSHRLAKIAGFSPDQVRRDLMVIGYSGSPAHGYNVVQLLESIGEFIDSAETEGVALAGLGHVGQAILNYFRGRRKKLEIAVVFDNDPTKVNRMFQGLRCYHTNEIGRKVRGMNIRVGILAVPPEGAQEIAEKLVNAGIRGILNYAPVKLELPENVYIENRDMIMAVEKAAYYARKVDDKEPGHDGLS